MKFSKDSKYSDFLRISLAFGKVGFIPVSFLSFCLVLFLFPLPVFSQLPLGEKMESLEYTAADFRDPFNPQIVIPKEEEPETGKEMEEIVARPRPKISELFAFSIQGIIWNPDNPMVIINNQVLKRGDVILTQKVEDATEEVIVTDINKDGVTIIYMGEVERLPSPAFLELQKIKGGRDE